MIKTIFADRMVMLRTQAAAGDNMAQAIVALFDSDIQTQFQVVTPAAKSANSVAAALAANAAGPFVISASPAAPRNLRVVFATSWDGGNVTVIGTDQFDQPVTESFTGASNVTVVGTKIFKTVTSASKSAVGATANTASIGTGDKLGLVVKGSQAFCLVGDSTPTAMAPATYDNTYNGFTPANVPNGSLTYTVSLGV